MTQGTERDNIMLGAEIHSGDGGYSIGTREAHDKFVASRNASMEKPYDVVLAVLQEHHDRLWDITRRNMQSEFLGMSIMDDIRLEQMQQLKLAMKMWKERND